MAVYTQSLVPALALALALASAPRARALSCLDESGAAVGWWLVVKLHGSTTSYSYSDASSPAYSGPLRLKSGELDSPASALGATLSQLIVTRGASVRISWNDELPPKASTGGAGTAAAGADGADSDADSNATSATSGHTKGVIGADASGGFWLTHSLPKFPDLAAQAFSWGAASKLYGQTFLCVSLDAAGIDEAAKGVSFVDPLVYDSAVPSGALSTLYPSVVALLAGTRGSGTRQTNVSSIDGTKFTHFGKSGSTGVDIYEDVIQPALGVALLCETWLRPPVMPSYCAPQYAFDSINVEAMQFLGPDGTTPERFRYTQDHTKLALAVNGTSQQHWIGIGDNNRMSSQWTRGGGMVFFRHAALYAPLLASVVELQPCPAAAGVGALRETIEK